MSKYLLEGETSARLRFRAVVPKDMPAWVPFYDDPDSTAFWTGLPKDPEVACREQFQRIFERYQNKLGGMNALLLRENNIFVGLCGLLVQTVDGIRELEIGYSLLPAYRKKGYATEAARKCRDYALMNHLAPSLISIIHIDNIPSQKVALKNGMFLDKTTTYKSNPVHIYRVFPKGG